MLQSDIVSLLLFQVFTLPTITIQLPSCKRKHTMDAEDREVIRNERDASPERFNSYAGPAQREPLDRRITEGGRDSDAESVELQEIRTQNQARGPLSRRDTVGSSYSLARTETERINRAERHPGALDRIETHRTQHSHTIGSGRELVGSLSRRSTANKAKPLPNFGAGKPFPPPLPEQEEYVVEFDGHDVSASYTSGLVGTGLMDIRIPYTPRIGP